MASGPTAQHPARPPRFVRWASPIVLLLVVGSSFGLATLRESFGSRRGSDETDSAAFALAADLLGIASPPRIGDLSAWRDYAGTLPDPAQAAGEPFRALEVQLARFGLDVADARRLLDERVAEAMPWTQLLDRLALASQTPVDAAQVHAAAAKLDRLPASLQAALGRLLWASIEAAARQELTLAPLDGPSRAALRDALAAPPPYSAEVALLLAALDARPILEGAAIVAAAVEDALPVLSSWSYVATAPTPPAVVSARAAERVEEVLAALPASPSRTGPVPSLASAHETVQAAGLAPFVANALTGILGGYEAALGLDPAEGARRLMDSVDAALPSLFAASLVRANSDPAYRHLSENQAYALRFWSGLQAEADYEASDLVRAGAALAGIPVPEELASRDSPDVLSAFDAFYEAFGRQLSPDERTTLSDRIAELDPSLREALRIALDGITETRRLFDEAGSQLGAADRAALEALAPTAAKVLGQPRLSLADLALVSHFQLLLAKSRPDLRAAAQVLLVEAIEHARDVLRPNLPPPPAAPRDGPFDWLLTSIQPLFPPGANAQDASKGPACTVSPGGPGGDYCFIDPTGSIVISNSDSTEFPPDFRAVLHIDLGGNDIYRGAAASAPTGVSVLLEMAGNDRYDAQEPGQGCLQACAGGQAAALLYEDQGADTYRAGDNALGAVTSTSSFAMFWDRAGRSDIQAGSHAMGWAGGTSSLAIAATGAESDSIRIKDQGLGFGASTSTGVYVNRGGNDAYNAGAFAFGAGPTTAAQGLFLDLDGRDVYTGPGPAGAAVHTTVLSSPIEQLSQQTAFAQRQDGSAWTGGALAWGADLLPTSGDRDGDGVSDFLENCLGSDASDPTSIPEYGVEDADQDGFWDGADEDPEDADRRPFAPPGALAGVGPDEAPGADVPRVGRIGPLTFPPPSGKVIEIPFPAAFSVSVDAALLVLDDVQASAYDRNYAIALSLGGQDRWTNNAGSDIATSSGTLVPGYHLDLDGSDEYGSPTQDRTQGSARAATFGILMDLAGDDQYVARDSSQGSYDATTESVCAFNAACHGLGLLFDAAGADSYTAGLRSQAAVGAGGGTGLLIDLGGNDHYQAPQHAGTEIGVTFSATPTVVPGEAFAALLDGAGRDVYEYDAPPAAAAQRMLTAGGHATTLFADLAGLDTYACSCSSTAEADDTLLTRSGDNAQGIFWDIDFDGSGSPSDAAERLATAIAGSKDAGHDPVTGDLESPTGFVVDIPALLGGPAGLLAIGSLERTVYDRNYLLSVDLGGEDLYLANAGGTSLITALRSTTVNGTGGVDAGLNRVPLTMPVAIGIDVGGESDAYSGAGIVQGAGILGTGILVDDGGDETYSAGTLAQGAATAGFGALVDLGGDDRYEAARYAQGAALDGGHAALIDHGGDDHYQVEASGIGHTEARTDPEDATYARQSQTKTVTAGTLRQYEGQRGPGDVPASALFLDGAGDDSYEAVSDAAGSATGFSVVVLLDLGGNDNYRVRTKGLGFADQRGSALVLDLAGADVYELQTYGLGATLTLGSTGLFWDVRGRDTYFGRRWSLGWSELRPGPQVTPGSGSVDALLQTPTHGPVGTTTGTTPNPAATVPGRTTETAATNPGATVAAPGATATATATAPGTTVAAPPATAGDVTATPSAGAPGATATVTHTATPRNVATVTPSTVGAGTTRPAQTTSVPVNGRFPPGGAFFIDTNGLDLYNRPPMVDPNDPGGSPREWRPSGSGEPTGTTTSTAGTTSTVTSTLAASGDPLSGKGIDLETGGPPCPGAPGCLASYAAFWEDGSEFSADSPTHVLTQPEVLRVRILWRGTPLPQVDAALVDRLVLYRETRAHGLVEAQAFQPGDDGFFQIQVDPSDWPSGLLHPLRLDLWVRAAPGLAPEPILRDGQDAAVTRPLLAGGVLGNQWMGVSAAASLAGARLQMGFDVRNPTTYGVRRDGGPILAELPRSHGWHEATFETGPAGDRVALDGQTLWSGSTPLPIAHAFFGTDGPTLGPGLYYDEVKAFDGGNTQVFRDGIAGPPGGKALREPSPWTFRAPVPSGDAPEFVLAASASRTLDGDGSVRLVEGDTLDSALVRTSVAWPRDQVERVTIIFFDPLLETERATPVPTAAESFGPRVPSAATSGFPATARTLRIGFHAEAAATYRLQIQPASGASFYLDAADQATSTLVDRTATVGPNIATWDGLGPDGSLVPDGTYDIRALPASGSPWPAQARVRVDATPPTGMTLVPNLWGATTPMPVQVGYSDANPGKVTHVLLFSCARTPTRTCLAPADWARELVDAPDATTGSAVRALFPADWKDGLTAYFFALPRDEVGNVAHQGTATSVDAIVDDLLSSFDPDAPAAPFAASRLDLQAPLVQCIRLLRDAEPDSCTPALGRVVQVRGGEAFTVRADVAPTSIHNPVQSVQLILSPHTGTGSPVTVQLEDCSDPVNTTLWCKDWVVPELTAGEYDLLVKATTATRDPQVGSGIVLDVDLSPPLLALLPPRYPAGRMAALHGDEVVLEARPGPGALTDIDGLPTLDASALTVGPVAFPFVESLGVFRATVALNKTGVANGCYPVPVQVRDGVDNGAEFQFLVCLIGDATPILDPVLHAVQPTRALVTWHTLEATEGSIEWGPADGGFPSSAPATLDGLSASALIDGLEPASRAHARIRVINGNGISAVHDLGEFETPSGVSLHWLGPDAGAPLRGAIDVPMEPTSATDDPLVLTLWSSTDNGASWRREATRSTPVQSRIAPRVDDVRGNPAAGAVGTRVAEGDLDLVRTLLDPARFGSVIRLCVDEGATTAPDDDTLVLTARPANAAIGSFQTGDLLLPSATPLPAGAPALARTPAACVAQAADGTAASAGAFQICALDDGDAPDWIVLDTGSIPAWKSRFPVADAGMGPGDVRLTPTTGANAALTLVAAGDADIPTGPGRCDSAASPATFPTLHPRFSDTDNDDRLSLGTDPLYWSGALATAPPIPLRLDTTRTKDATNVLLRANASRGTDAASRTFGPFVFDNTPPKASEQSPRADSATNTTLRPIRFRLVDATSGLAPATLQVTVNGATREVLRSGSLVQVAGPEDGATQAHVEVLARDLAGNTLRTAWNYHIDASAPALADAEAAEVTADNGGSLLRPGGTGRVALRLLDESTITEAAFAAQSAGVPWTPLARNPEDPSLFQALLDVPADAPNGPHDIWFRFADTHGNTRTDVLGRLVVDAIPPTIEQAAVIHLGRGQAEVLVRAQEPIVARVTSDGGGAWSTALVGRVLHEIPILNLTSPVPTRLHVEVEDAAGNLASTDLPFSPLASGAPPPKVSRIRLAELGTDSARLAWDADASATSFLVLRRGADGVLAPWAETARKSFRDAPLEEGGRYEYAVAAVDASGQRGPISEPVSLVVPAHPFLGDPKVDRAWGSASEPFQFTSYYRHAGAILPESVDLHVGDQIVALDPGSGDCRTGCRYQANLTLPPSRLGAASADFHVEARVDGALLRAPSHGEVAGPIVRADLSALSDHQAEAPSGGLLGAVAGLAVALLLRRRGIA